VLLKRVMQCTIELLGTNVYKRIQPNVSSYVPTTVLTLLHLCTVEYNISENNNNI